MGRYIPPEKMTVQQILEEVEKEYARWNYIANNGCQDPFWSDGCNMNLIRNHIIYWYNILETKKSAELDELGYQQQEQLSLFAEAEKDAVTYSIRPLPPAVPDEYMVAGCKYSDRLKNRIIPELVWGYKGEYKA